MRSDKLYHTCHPQSLTNTQNRKNQKHRQSQLPRQTGTANHRQTQRTACIKITNCPTVPDKERWQIADNPRQQNRQQRPSTTDRPTEQTTDRDLQPQTDQQNRQQTFNHRPTTDRDLQPQTTEQTTHRDPDLKSKVTAPATTGEATLVPDRERQPDL